MFTKKSDTRMNSYNCPKTTAQLRSDQKTGIYEETDAEGNNKLDQLEERRHRLSALSHQRQLLSHWICRPTFDPAALVCTFEHKGGSSCLHFFVYPTQLVKIRNSETVASEFIVPKNPTQGRRSVNVCGVPGSPGLS